MEARKEEEGDVLPHTTYLSWAYTLFSNPSVYPSLEEEKSWSQYSQISYWAPKAKQNKVQSENKAHIKSTFEGKPKFKIKSRKEGFSSTFLKVPDGGE